MKIDRFPYQERAVATRLGVGLQLGVAAATSYASGGNWVANQSPEMLDQFAPGIEQHSTLFRVGSGAAGLYFGVRGIRELATSDYYETKATKRWRLARGGADLITAVGLASQAFGAGTWAAGLTAAGLLTTTILQISKANQEVG